MVENSGLWSQAPQRGRTDFSIWKMGDVKLRVVKIFSQGHTASWDLNSDLPNCAMHSFFLDIL